MERPDPRWDLPANRPQMPRWQLPPAGPSVRGRALPPPPPRPMASGSADPRPAGRTDHQATIRRLKRASIAGAAIAVAAFAVLVSGHHVGVTTTTAQPANGQGSPATGVGPVQAAAPVDPFFDPNPGSVTAGGVQPVFGLGGGGGNGAGPAFQSSGS